MSTLTDVEISWTTLNDDGTIGGVVRRGGRDPFDPLDWPTSPVDPRLAAAAAAEYAAKIEATARLRPLTEEQLAKLRRLMPWWWRLARWACAPLRWIRSLLP